MNTKNDSPKLVSFTNDAISQILGSLLSPSDRRTLFNMLEKVTKGDYKEMAKIMECTLSNIDQYFDDRYKDRIPSPKSAAILLWKLSHLDGRKYDIGIDIGIETIFSKVKLEVLKTYVFLNNEGVYNACQVQMDFSPGSFLNYLPYLFNIMYFDQWTPAPDPCYPGYTFNPALSQRCKEEEYRKKVIKESIVKLEEFLNEIQKKYQLQTSV